MYLPVSKRLDVQKTFDYLGLKKQCLYNSNKNVIISKEYTLLMVISDFPWKFLCYFIYEKHCTRVFRKVMGGGGTLMII